MILEHANVAGDGTITCPVCGGTTFTNKRSVKDRALWGILGFLPFLTPKSLTCDGCRTQVKLPPGSVNAGRELAG
jgi:hypothetical protein